LSDRLAEEQPVLASNHGEVARSAEKLLKESGVGFLTHRWRPFTSFDELLHRQGTHKVVRTIAVQVPDRMVLVCLRAEDELDFGKLAGALGIDRDPITLAAPGRVTETLEVDPGFETILTDANVDRFLDEKVLKLDKVLVSSGRNDRLIELRPHDLASVSRATLSDLAVEQPS
jgi:prolyl-tRNA editing enzyme YbaK/EbsC (Cys-tRNA(Pro) deacylase)